MSVKTHKIHLKWSKFFGYEKWDSDNIPESKGVYEYFIRLKQGGRRIIYVGIADDLRKRSKEHLSKDEKNKCLKDNLEKIKWDFRYAPVPLKDDREDAELTLYKKHKPKCNVNEPCGSGRKLEVELAEE